MEDNSVVLDAGIAPAVVKKMLAQIVDRTNVVLENLPRHIVAGLIA
jgi:hypothetical protein